MHESAMMTGKAFFAEYGQKAKTVLDVGAFNINGTLRDALPQGLEYYGVDLTEGQGVDYVLDDTGILPFSDESFDLVVSTSCLEHDPCYWLTFAEMARSQATRPLHAVRKRAVLSKQNKTEAAPATSPAKSVRGNVGSRHAKKPTPAALKEGIKPLVSLGRKKGYLTYDEVNSFLPEEVTSGDQIDKILNLFDEMDIEVVDEAERAKATKSPAPQQEEEGAETEPELAPSTAGRTDDPVRMYLREMGKTPLLTRDGEIQIAKRIEEGHKDVAEAVCRAGVAVREITEIGERLLHGKARIYELLSLNEFDEISEQKERELLAENTPSLEALREEQVKIDGLRRRYQRGVGRLSERWQQKIMDEMARRKAAQATLIRGLHINQRVIERVVARIRNLLERIEQGEQELREDRKSV